MDCNPTSIGGNRHIIMVMDYFTKWVEAMPMVKYNGNMTTFSIFNQIIAQFGNPKEIVVENSTKNVCLIYFPLK
jgi:hypothetical protein